MDELSVFYAIYVFKDYTISVAFVSSFFQVQLFNQILNHYVLFYEDGNSLISIEMINEVSSTCQ